MWPWTFWCLSIGNWTWFLALSSQTLYKLSYLTRSLIHHYWHNYLNMSRLQFRDKCWTLCHDRTGHHQYLPGKVTAIYLFPMCLTQLLSSSFLSWLGLLFLQWNTMTKMQVGRKGLFCLYLQDLKLGRNLEADTVEQPWRSKAAYWLSHLSLLALLSYRTWDHRGIDGTTYLPKQSLIRKMPYNQILWSPFFY